MSKKHEAGQVLSNEAAMKIALAHGEKVRNCKCVETIPMLQRKCTYCQYQELTDLEHENFADKAFESYECVSAFVEATYEDFEYAMQDRGIDQDYYCDHETDWCERRMDEFLEFAFGFFNKQKAG